MSVTMTGSNKSSTITMNPMAKAGSGLDYDSDYAYDATVDEHGRVITYDGVGTAPTMTGQTKSSATTLNPLAKS